MSEPFLGEIRMFGGNFAPRGWAFCNGQLLSIAQNTALFSILGTTYGGDGRVTFGLPDLRGRVPINAGQGPGLSSYTLGEVAGNENVTLIQAQIPPHSHTVACNTGPASAPSPANNVLAAPVDSQGGAGNGYTPAANATMSPAMIGTTGGGSPISIVQPLLCSSFIIALEGIFPSRN